MNNSNKTVEFFTKAAHGEYEPDVKYRIPYDRELELKIQDEYHYYRLYEDAFDRHIAASIPGFLEVSLCTIKAIRNMYKSGRVLDIGSSNSTWGKTLAYMNQGLVVTSIDPNDSMRTSTGQTNNFKFINESFYHECCDKHVHNPSYKYDVIRESMVFQFITPHRNALFGEVKRMLADDGIFLCEEKFLQKGYALNEIKKDEFKAKHFNDTDLNNKKTVLISMSENQSWYADTISALKRKFKYVYTYWISGNFAGIASSSSKKTIDSFIERINSSLKGECVIGSYIFKPVEVDTVYDLAVIGERIRTGRCVDDIVPDNNSHYYCITNTETDAIAALRVFVDKDNVKNAELCYLRKDMSSLDNLWHKKAMDARLEYCLNNGIDNIYLSCYDIKHLVKLNSSYGFREVSRVKFDPKKAVDCWNEDLTLQQKPDILIMKLKLKAVNEQV